MVKITGAKTLSKFILRRDRSRIIIWVTLLTLISIYVTIAFPMLYPTATDTQAIVEALENPAMVAMLGPYYGDSENHTIGAIFSAEMLLFTALTVATMNILLVTRHTRKDEEEGRHEVIRALPVNKISILFSTFIIYLIVNLVMGLLIGIGIASISIESMGWEGSLLYGLSLSVIGIFFAASTGVFAQLTQSSRSTLRYAFGFLGIMYILRGFGDVNSEALSLSLPLGLILRTKPFTENNWWPVAAVLISSMIFIYIAFRLNKIRDLDASFIPDKPGRVKASIFLKGPLGLAWRNQRITIIWWAVAMMSLGVSYGSVLGDVENFFAGNEIYQKLLENIGDTGTMVEQFVVMLHAVIAMVGTIPVLQIIIKLRSEERHNHIEHLLGRSLSRYRLLLSSITLGIIVSIIMLFSGTYGLYSAGARVSTTPMDFELMLRASSAYLPAIWTFMALTVLLLGMLPNAIKAIWIYLGFAFVSIYFGGILQFPDWLVKLSPFGHIQKIPVENYRIVSGTFLILISVFLILIGALKYRTRDLEG